MFDVVDIGLLETLDRLDILSNCIFLVGSTKRSAFDLLVKCLDIHRALLPACSPFIDTRLPGVSAATGEREEKMGCLFAEYNGRWFIRKVRILGAIW